MKINFLIACCLWTISGFGQISPVIERKVDSIFQRWNTENTPGYSVAIVKNGRMVFSKGYGMANLEYGIAVNPGNSIFHIASESKQFMAFCMVLLAQEGKLSLDDDIRKYLPYVPDFGKKITIKHLIYHTSGLRDQWQALAIGGMQLDDVITSEHVIKMVAGQKELNFAPGEQMLYCNTGYTLMGEIVNKVSGQSLRKFADERIFKPLGMTHTHFHDDYTEIVKNRAYSYRPADSAGFRKAVLSYSLVGATSLFTTAEDEAKWLINYETGQVGGKAAVNQMFQRSVLNDGSKTDYAFGLVIDTYNGKKRISHGGSDAGFRSFTCRFPDLDLGLVVFSNVSTGNPAGMAMRIADLFTDKDTSIANPVANATYSLPQPKYSSEPYTLSTAEIAALTGDYYSDELEATYHIIRKNDKLVLRHRKHPDSILKPEAANEFSTDHWWMKNLFFQKDKNNRITGFEITSGRIAHLRFKKVL